MILEMNDSVVDLNCISLLTPINISIMRTTTFKNSKRIKWSTYRNYSVESFTIFLNPKSIHMKTVMLILFTLIFSAQTFAQEAKKDYLDADRKNASPKEVLELVETAAELDVTKQSDFDGRDKPYTVVFKSNKGAIHLTYDKKGKVIHSNELFKNINLPYQLTNYVLRQYPDHKIVGNKYKLYSKNGKVTKSSYNIVVQNGNVKKHLEFNNSMD